MVYRLIVAYRGTAYAGWQLQPNELTIQEVLEGALVDLLGESLRVVAAGRTDAGVHARGQAVHFELAREFPLRGMVHGTNHRLPDDIRVMHAQRMQEGFHARFEALGKRYRYRLSRAAVVSPLDAPFVVAAPRGLELEPMRQASDHLPGEHDFSAFALAGGAHRSSVRRLTRAVWEESGDELSFIVEGEGFLRGMVRSLVGTLLEVGLGRRTPEEFAALLEGAPRADAGVTAAARGLVLEEVHYSEEWALGPGVW